MNRRAAEQNPVAGVLIGLGKNLLATFIGIAITLLLLEIGLRLVYFSNDSRVLVYPRVASYINGFRDPDFEGGISEGDFRMLALGASAFVTRNFQPEFQRLMNDDPFFSDEGLRVRVASTGVPAHMTYDSLWKYQFWYANYDFDLVIFYHGINDARANNYPPEVFRDDYTQFIYYRQFVQIFDWRDRHPRLSNFFVATLGAKIFGWFKIRLDPDFQSSPYNKPSDDPWLVEGSDIKSARVFEKNLEEMLGLAKARDQRVLLLTYAYYLPADYTNQRFMSQLTDYSFKPESVAVEIWGTKEGVIKAIKTHNEVIRAIAARHPEALFFDMERFIPKDSEHFIDVCHWTDKGRARFAEGVSQALRDASESVLAPALGRR